ncbi:MAG: LON peptidase substrate-binding domain-containing protein [Ruthenibacterium lactatiformans]
MTAQQDMDVEDPGFKDLYAYGVVAEVKQVLRVSDELVKVLVEGKYCAKLLTLDSSGRFLLAPYQGRRAARDKIGRFRTRGGAGAQCERSL